MLEEVERPTPSEKIHTLVRIILEGMFSEEDQLDDWSIKLIAEYVYEFYVVEVCRDKLMSLDDFFNKRLNELFANFELYESLDYAYEDLHKPYDTSLMNSLRDYVEDDEFMDKIECCMSDVLSKDGHTVVHTTAGYAVFKNNKVYPNRVGGI